MWFESRGRRAQTYTHHPLPFPPDLLNTIVGSPHLPSDQLANALEHAKVDPDSAHSMSAAFRVRSFFQADSLAASIACDFLSENARVQYATCARHPIEFWAFLQSVWEARNEQQAWSEVAMTCPQEWYHILC